MKPKYYIYIRANIYQPRDLFRKIGNIKGAFHPKMGTIKDKNSKVLLDAEEIKKRWNDYKEELYKKGS